MDAHRFKDELRMVSTVITIKEISIVLTAVINPEIPPPMIPNLFSFVAATNVSLGFFCCRYSTPSNQGPIGSETSANVALFFIFLGLT